MKKILVAFDGSAYAEGALDYALHLSENGNALIVGVFIEDLSYVGFTSYFGQEYLLFDYGLLATMKEEANEQITKSMSLFEKKCKDAGANYKIHRDAGVAADELVNESIYADAIIIGFQTFFSSVGKLTEDGFLKDVLKDSKCPVLITPDHYEPVKTILFTYDGKASSVFAIKQFTYIFPELTTNNNVKLLYVKKDKDDQPAGLQLLQEYLTVHYPNIESIERIGDQPAEEIQKVAGEAGNSMVVMGSYGRSVFSRMFSKSAAKGLIESKSTPMFITHL